MCGICGKLVLNGRPDLVDRYLLRSMMQSMRHRGPDDEGMYISGPIGLGHKRLSIIDLNTGKQPISNEDGTIWVVFNGEIYNFKDLTSYLVQRGHKFRTATDTEAIVHLYEEFGEGCIAKLRGMFSFALWDEKAKALLIARDRVGIKPLYYHLGPAALIFASEIKAILADLSVTAEVDPSVLRTFLAYFHTPGERTVFKGINKLSPGHYMSVKEGEVRVKQYWDLHFQSHPEAKSLDDSTGRLVELLRSTVRDHMISDVPVGILLSGGVDSTAMLSFAVEQTKKEVSTFTIGFEESLCTDERPFARIAANHFGAKHHEMTITVKNFLDFLPKYVWHMEEPVCEAAAIALYYVSKLAKDSGVTVLISGEGGDEAFAGYRYYRNLVWLERIKKLLGPMAGPTSSMAEILGRVLRSWRIAKYAPLLTVPLEKYYYTCASDAFSYFNRNTEELYTGDFLSQTNGHTGSKQTEEYFAALSGSKHLDQMLYIDTKTYLPDDLLIKADRMTMANSVELRVPFLDHQVLELAASLPVEFKLRGLTTKYILKRALSGRIPPEIINRRKAGFPVPYVKWIQGELRDTISAILLDPRTVQRGYFRKSALEQLIKRNSNGHNYSKEIFSLLTLELWHRTFIDHKQCAPQ